MSRRTVVALLPFALSLVLAASASAATIPGQYIVVLKDGVSEPATAADHARKGAEVFQQYRHALNGYAARLSQAELASVKADRRVLFVSEDAEVKASATCPINTLSGFPTQCIPPGVDRIDGDLSSTRSGDGSGSVNVNVAVLDTGIDVDHPDLNVVGGKNCSGGKGFDEVGTDIPHGTFVGGIIGAKDNSFGVVGVAPGARLWAVRVLDKHGHGSTSELICGIDFVTSTRTDGDPTNDIAVANMSLGGKGRDGANCGGQFAAIHRAICRSVAAGVTYVAAPPDVPTDFQADFPSSYDEVLATTAMADFDGRPGGLVAGTRCGDFDDTFADFSAFATLPADQAHTIAAPGVCIVSTISVGFLLPASDTNYGIASGTSFSAPHAAGTAALCIADGACAGMTPAQVIQKLRADAEAYTTANPGYGFYGDPGDPQAGEYFGYLIRAGGY